MKPAERLTLRARQLLDDPTLSPNQRIDNADALMKQLITTIALRPETLEPMLADIADVAVRDAMRAAVTAGTT